MRPGLAFTAWRTDSAAASKRAFASVTFFADRSAPRDSASCAYRSIGVVIGTRAVVIATLGASGRILSLLSSGTYQSAPGSYMWVTSSSGRRAAYFSTLNSPHTLPRISTLSTFRSPACGSAVPSARFVSPNTPTICLSSPKSTSAAAVPVKATTRVGRLAALTFSLRSSVNDQGPRFRSRPVWRSRRRCRSRP